MELILITHCMKSIVVEDDLHKWIMDNKNSEKTSAEKVIWGLIRENDMLKKQVTKLEEELLETYTI